MTVSNINYIFVFCDFLCLNLILFAANATFHRASFLVVAGLEGSCKLNGRDWEICIAQEKCQFYIFGDLTFLSLQVLCEEAGRLRNTSFRCSRFKAFRFACVRLCCHVCVCVSAGHTWGDVWLPTLPERLTGFIVCRGASIHHLPTMWHGLLNHFFTVKEGL